MQAMPLRLLEEENMFLREQLKLGREKLSDFEKDTPMFNMAIASERKWHPLVIATSRQEPGARQIEFINEFKDCLQHQLTYYVSDAYLKYQDIGCQLNIAQELNNMLVRSMLSK